MRLLTRFLTYVSLFLAVAAPAAEARMRFVDGQVLVPGSQPVKQVRLPRGEGNAWETLRFEVFGSATVALRWESGDDRRRFLRVEGPLAETGEEAAPLRATLVAEGRGASLLVPLPREGVYRVIAASRDDEPRLRARCAGACTRPTIFLADLLNQLAAKERAVLSERVEGFLGTLVTDRRAVGPVVTRWRDALAAPRFDRATIDRIFTLPPFRVSIAFRPLLGHLGGREPRATAERLDVELAAFLASMTIPPVRPEPLDRRISARLGFDHFRSRALPPQVLRGSLGLARVLAALSLGNSRVRPPGEKAIESVDTFVRWLLASGHRIEMKSDRTYANFLSLTWDDTNVRWPVWLDTGLGLSDGTTLVVPTGHSQFTWSVRGPVVNGDVGFYLGSTAGAGFFPRIDVRPDWARMRTVETVSSEEGAGRRRIRATLAAAETYLRRIRREAETVARGMAADGYGYLGICNDATAALEGATGQRVDVYPVVRAAELQRLSPVRDRLTEVLAALPNDAESDPRDGGYRRNALCRVLRMSPFSLASPRLLDAPLRNQLQRAARDVGNACSREEAQ